ncbi:MAG: aminoacyl-tRNA hydrolase [Planctomycetes bacterium]|nr:aminoacyl-tRNA hydrolase [Planctomycetota bacterium]
MSDASPEGALVLSTGIIIPSHDLEFHFSRSGGPGGQNVNKVATKAELRFRPAASRGLPPGDRDRILARLASRLNQCGEIVFRSQEHRTQSANRRACIEKLRALLDDALRPRKKRIPTRPTRASKEKRLAAKKRRSRHKSSRGKPGSES